MTLGESIRLHRKRKGLTQKKLAELAGLSTGAIQQYELNKRQPKYETVKRIAEIIDMSIVTASRGRYMDPYILPQPTMDDIFEGLQFQVAHGKDELHTKPSHTLNESEFTLINYFRICNKKGKRKILEYAKDTVKIPEYQLDPDQDPLREEDTSMK